MADELKMTVVTSYSDEDGLELPNLGIVDDTFDVTTKQHVSGTPSVGTSEEAIPLGEVTAAGAHITVVNLDASNYIEIRSATGASNDHVKLPAGEACAFRFGSDVTAPYWVANTAAVKVHYRIVAA